jgi:hypothetical protein
MSLVEVVGGPLDGAEIPTVMRPKIAWITRQGKLSARHRPDRLLHRLIPALGGGWVYMFYGYTRAYCCECESLHEIARDRLSPRTECSVCGTALVPGAP